MKSKLFFQSRQQTAVHLVASRQTGTATSILRALLTAAGKDIRIKADGVFIEHDNYLFTNQSFVCSKQHSLAKALYKSRFVPKLNQLTKHGEVDGPFGVSSKAFHT